MHQLFPKMLSCWLPQMAEKYIAHNNSTSHCTVACHAHQSSSPPIICFAQGVKFPSHQAGMHVIWEALGYRVIA